MTIATVPMTVASRLATVIQDDLSDLDPEGYESCFAEHRAALAEFLAYCELAAGQQSLALESAP